MEIRKNGIGSEALEFQLTYLAKRRTWFDEQVKKLNFSESPNYDYQLFLENFIIQYANSQDFESYVYRNS